MMQNAIYQFSLIVGMGTLSVLLIRGYTLMVALQRSGLVLIIVLIVLVFAANIIKFGIQPGSNLDEMGNDNEEASPPEQIPGGETDE